MEECLVFAGGVVGEFFKKEKRKESGSPLPDGSSHSSFPPSPIMVLYTILKEKKKERIREKENNIKEKEKIKFLKTASRICTYVSFWEIRTFWQIRLICR